MSLALFLQLLQNLELANSGLWTVAVMTGMRRGEALSHVQWADLYFY